MNDGALRQPRALLGGHDVARRRHAHGRALSARPRSDASRACCRASSISNGIGWSPDDRVDVPRGHAARRRVDVYEFDAGGRRDRRAGGPRSRWRRTQGRPDGLAVDAEGGIWVALWGGGAVQRFSPEGEPDLRTRACR